MISPKRVKLLANISKAFTDQGIDPPTADFFKGKNGKPVPTRMLRHLARKMGTSVSEAEAREVMKDVFPELPNITLPL